MVGLGALNPKEGPMASPAELFGKVTGNKVELLGIPVEEIKTEEPAIA